MARVRTRGFDEKKAENPGNGGGGAYPPEGEYEARILDVLDGESASGGDKVVVEVEVFVGDETCVRKAHIGTSNESRMNNLILAVRRSDDPDDVDTGEFAGRPCRVVIEHSEPDRNGRRWANIEKFLPAAGRREERGRDGGRRDEREQRRDERGDRQRNRVDQRRDDRRDDRRRDRDGDRTPF